MFPSSLGRLQWGLPLFSSPSLTGPVPWTFLHRRGVPVLWSSSSPPSECTAKAEHLSCAGGPPEGQVEVDIHHSHPAGHSHSDADQGRVGILGCKPAHCWLMRRLNISPSTSTIYSCLYSTENQTSVHVVKGGLTSPAEEQYNRRNKICYHKHQNNMATEKHQTKVRRMNSPVSNVRERQVVDEVLQQCY